MSAPDTNGHVAARRTGGKRSERKRLKSESAASTLVDDAPQPSSLTERGSASSSRSSTEKASPKYFTPREIHNLKIFKNFLSLEAEHNLLGIPEKAMLEKIKKNRDFQVVFLSASSCRRHVYIFRQSDALEQTIIPQLQELAKSTSKAGNLRIYLGMDGLKFLMTWLSGSLNEGKYCNDTYNRKTVNTCVELFGEFLEMRKISKGDFGAFGKEFTRLQNHLDAEIRDLRKKAPPNFEEKIKWLETKKEEASRMKEFNFLRVNSTSKPDEFFVDLRDAFAVADKLCSVFEKIKYLPSIKELWSGVIKKETLDIIKEEDRDLFLGIMKCRKDFIDFTSHALLEALIDTTMTIDEVNGRITEKFAPAIKELSLAARKIIPPEKLSPDLPASPAGVAEPPTEEIAGLVGDLALNTIPPNPLLDYASEAVAASACKDPEENTIAPIPKHFLSDGDDRACDSGPTTDKLNAVGATQVKAPKTVSKSKSTAS